MAGLAKRVKVSDQLQLIKQQLDPWCEPRGGTCKVIANLAHLFEELIVMVDQPRILIVCTGEEPKGDEAQRAVWRRVNRTFQVIVVRGHGFNNTIAVEGGNNEAFTDSWEKIRDLVRCIANISEEFPVEYLGCEPLPSVAPTPAANVFMDAIALRFSTANDLPGITNQVQQNPVP